VVDEETCTTCGGVGEDGNNLELDIGDGFWDVFCSWRCLGTYGLNVAIEEVGVPVPRETWRLLRQAVEWHGGSLPEDLVGDLVFEERVLVPVENL
jgi:hypothetical protein